MSVVDKVTISGLDNRFPDLGGVLIAEVKKAVIEEFKKEVWRWYNNNFSRVLFSKKIMFWTISVTVAQCRWLIEELVGKEGV